MPQKLLNAETVELKYHIQLSKEVRESKVAGIKKIKIPVLPENLSIEAILPYLQYVLGEFQKNRRKIRKNWKVFENQHNILEKKRRYDDDSDVNNVVATPYLYEMVCFKSGYAFGNPKEYAQSTEEQTEALKFLNRYCKDANERSKDKNVAVYNYALGSGYYFIEPRKDNFDSEFESPYVIYDKSPETCAKVYSSYNGEPELFDVLFTDLSKFDENGGKQNVTILSIYLPDMYYEVEYNSDFQYPANFKELTEKRKARPIYKMLPLVEKYSNESRLGIIELCMSIQDAIDKLNSNQIDNVEDLVNELLVFMNTVLGKDQDEEAMFLKNAKRNGVIVLNDKNPDIKADVKTLSNKLDYNGIMAIINNLKRDMFDSCGVPIPSSDISSGGMNNGAAEKGNGYDNAYNRILDDYNSFEIADREVLKRKLFICKSFANSKLNDLFASDIDIKYNPNMSDNMLTKSQSYTNFVEHDVPPVLAIQWCRIQNDAITPANQIKKYKEELAAKNAELLAMQNQQNDINAGNSDNISASTLKNALSEKT